ncbi:TIGR04325 family methyltransferase [Bradyrhizobium sp. CIAT3101]|uniref:TIGR04325 family methyltransferase n=1 Tax=Bradyrhizobium sp. CIAT3101 TaxID=439387 RepID=UPI0024B16E14|nr:TIGR04325 family methyltransferase [Bradyrhizobium sp. CIAT3101]WFU79133.1 TIGR04325 family methyltransferase [Bradyrhizobium sp. CIAT3101]
MSKLPATLQQTISTRPILFVRGAIGHLLALLRSSYLRHRGAYASFGEAVAAVRPGALVGYDNDEVVMHSFEYMSELKLEDYPVMFWLDRLLPSVDVILDAGGHLGTKHRAFGRHLEVDRAINWTIYDLSAIVRVGRRFLEEGKLLGVSFIDDLSDAPDADVLLASGLLQYLDAPFDVFLKKLPALPRHLLINKIQTREGPTVVTLENFGCAEIPYQIRNRTEFVATLGELGYDIIDEWLIPSLSRTIQTHPHLGRSVSRGYYARLREI